MTDPEFRALARRLASLGMSNPLGMTIAAARADSLRMRSLQDAPADVAGVRSLLIRGADGSSIEIRVYSPIDAGRRAPGIMYFHGGGWFMGDLEVADVCCRDLAAATGCVVVSVGYRLAPEVKFPGGVEDCYAACVWVAEHAAELGVDAGTLTVSGDSAGGNLAAAVALMARDRGAPLLRLQLLIYPMVAGRSSAGLGPQEGTAASHVPTDVIMGPDWCLDRYLRTDADLDDPYAVPLAASDLSGLPPAVIVGCEYDGLLAQGQQYAERLQAAGVPVRFLMYEKELHGFFWMGASVRPNYRRLLDDIAAEYRTAFAITTRTAHPASM